MPSWIDGEWLAALGIAGAVMAVASLVAMPWLVSLIPADYLVGPRRASLPWQDRHPALAVAWRVAKNLLGGVLLLAGLLMIVLPGQGILTMLAGLLLMDVPGKRRMEQKLIRLRGVLAALNWIRSKMNRPPLRVPDEDVSGRS